MGRPRKYATPEAFTEAVEAHVKHCREEDIPMTWTGLALALGFSSRESINIYEKYDGFSYAVKRAKLYVENHYEQRLSGNSPTGAIFALKNMGWSDRQEVEHSGSIVLRFDADDAKL